jgi:hypothetical protein
MSLPLTVNSNSPSGMTVLPVRSLEAIVLAVFSVGAV